MDAPPAPPGAPADAPLGAAAGALPPGTAAAIGRGTLAGWLHIAVAVAALPVQTALLVRFLPPADAGFWLTVLSFASYVTLFDFAVGPTLTRYIAVARGRAESRPGTASAAVTGADAEVADLRATAQRLYAALCAALLVVTLAAGPVAVRWATGRSFEGATAGAWVLFTLGAVANLAATERFATLAGLGVVGVNRIARMLAQLVGVGGTAAALLAGAGIAGVAAAWLAQNALFLLSGVLLLRRIAPGVAGRRGVPRRGVAREMLGPSLRWTAMNLGAALILASGPALVSRYLGPASVASYTAIQQLAVALFTISVVPATMSEPFVSRAHGAGDRRTIVELLLRNVRLVAIPLVGGAAYLWAFGGDVIALWLGAEHYPGDAALALILAVFVLEAHHVVHAGVVVATGRVVFVIPALLAGALTVGLAVSLVPRWGIVGMVASMGLAQLVTNNWFAPWYALRLLGVSGREYLRGQLPVFGFAAAALAVAAAAGWATRAMGPLGSAARAVIGFAAVGAATAALGWRLVLAPAERAAVVGFLRRGRA